MEPLIHGKEVHQARMLGALIRRERLKQNFSQEGLCRGICVVSYLSKIEQGRVEAGEEIICALLKRLGISYETDLEFLEKARRLIEDLYEKLYSDMLKEKDLKEIQKEQQRYLSSVYMLDVLLFQQIFTEERTASACETADEMQMEELREYVSCMNGRQYELYLYVEHQFGRGEREFLEKLLKLNPCGFYLTQAGIWYWAKGEYPQAVELLARGYAAASEEGTVRNMLLAKLMLGNCYSSTNNRELMMKNYMIAQRIAQAVGEKERIQDIYYNIAATFLEWNQMEEAEVYFQKCIRRDVLYYHKYAICKERLGKKQEALLALKKGRKEKNFPEVLVYQEMYDVVEYRLRHEHYQKEEAYENLLRTCMKHMRKELPKSYEKYHVPWLIEILEHQRKYKEICELMKEFS